MPSSPPLPHSTPIIDNPAPSSTTKTPRPRLRGFNYLRAQTSSTSNPLPTNSTVRESSGATRSISSPAESGRSPVPIIDHNILPSIRGADRTEQNTYLGSLESALRPFPSPSNCETLFRDMARTRAGSNPHGANAPNGERRTTNPATSGSAGHAQEPMPTIRLIPHQDPRSARPSLAFPATSRTLPHEDSVIRVGRYSERDTHPNPPANTPSSAPVGFKSKVVSRRHCEFWCSQGQWYIKDLKSSSGTFLNHIRLSQPSIESKPFPVHDGDVVQLGIDFRGGEEMIFRCVKIRVEVNRAWQKTLNNYNVQTHKRLRDLGRTVPKRDSDTASSASSECSICLMSIAPCQSLFVAPCSHVWHYKCIRPIINDPKNFPQFMCPNCRAVTDLEADVDDPLDDSWEEANIEGPESDLNITGAANDVVSEYDQQAIDGGDEYLSHSASRHLNIHDHDNAEPRLGTLTEPATRANMAPIQINHRGARQTSPPFTPSRDQSVASSPSTHAQYLRPITPTQPLLESERLDGSTTQVPIMTDHFAQDGPMTPTNNAGPFVFDGSAGRIMGRTEVVDLSENENTSSRT